MTDDGTARVALAIALLRAVGPRDNSAPPEKRHRMLNQAVAAAQRAVAAVFDAGQAPRLIWAPPRDAAEENALAYLAQQLDEACACAGSNLDRAVALVAAASSETALQLAARRPMLAVRLAAATTALADATCRGFQTEKADSARAALSTVIRMAEKCPHLATPALAAATDRTAAAIHTFPTGQRRENLAEWTVRIAAVLVLAHLLPSGDPTPKKTVDVLFGIMYRVAPQMSDLAGRAAFRMAARAIHALEKNPRRAEMATSHPRLRRFDQCPLRKSPT